MNFTIPVQLVSEANQSEHWRTKHGRKKKQQAIAFPHCHQAGIQGMKPASVTLTRVYAVCGRLRGKPMDEDNLAGSFKHVQDELSRWFKLDDGKIDWHYRQERGEEYGVRVEFET